MDALRIAATVFPPQTYPCSSSNLNPRPGCPTPGSDSEILVYLLRLCQIPYHLQVYNTSWGAHVNGTWTGLLGLIQNGTIDTISTTYQHLTLRTDHFDFSYPFRRSPFAFLVSKYSSGLGESAGIVFRVFDPVLWAVLLCMIIAVGLGVIAFSRYQHGRTETVSDSLWFCFRHLTNQHEPIGGNNFSKKLLLISGSVITFTFLPLYQNGLLTQLLLPPSVQTLTASDLVDGVQTGKFKLVANDTSFTFYQAVNQGASTFTRNLKNALMINPVLVENNMTRIIELVSAGTHIYEASYSAIVMLASRNCLLQAVTIADIFVENESYIFRKNYPSLALINEATITSISYIGYVNKKYETPLKSNCPDDSSTNSRPLGMTSLSGTLFLLLVGSGCALGIFVFEACLCLVFRFFQTS